MSKPNSTLGGQVFGTVDLFLSTASVAEIEKECIRHLHLGPGVSVQRLAIWSRFESLNNMATGEGGFLFFIPTHRIAYVFFRLASTGILSFPDVQVSECFSEIKLPSGVSWERVSESMNDSDLATLAVA